MQYFVQSWYILPMGCSLSQALGNHVHMAIHFKKGSITTAIKKWNLWFIPENAVYPVDGIKKRIAYNFPARQKR